MSTTPTHAQAAEAWATVRALLKGKALTSVETEVRQLALYFQPPAAMTYAERLPNEDGSPSVPLKIKPGRKVGAW